MRRLRLPRTSVSPASILSRRCLRARETRSSNCRRELPVARRRLFVLAPLTHNISAASLSHFASCIQNGAARSIQLRVFERGKHMTKDANNTCRTEVRDGVTLVFGSMEIMALAKRMKQAPKEIGRRSGGEGECKYE